MDKNRVGGLLHFSGFALHTMKLKEWVAPLVAINLAQHCGQIFVYMFDGAGQEFEDFLWTIPQVKNILREDDITWGGHCRQHLLYERSDAMFRAVDRPIDWILYPDADELLPPQVLSQLDIADATGKIYVEFPIVETRGITKVVKDFGLEYMIWYWHCHAVRFDRGVKFENSEGFCKPGSFAKLEKEAGQSLLYRSVYPMRHLRYDTVGLQQARTDAGNQHITYACRQDLELGDYRPDKIFWEYYNEWQALQNRK